MSAFERNVVAPLMAWVANTKNAIIIWLVLMVVMLVVGMGKALAHNEGHHGHYMAIDPARSHVGTHRIRVNYSHSIEHWAHDLSPLQLHWRQSGAPKWNRLDLGELRTSQSGQLFERTMEGLTPATAYELRLARRGGPEAARGDEYHAYSPTVVLETLPDPRASNCRYEHVLHSVPLHTNLTHRGTVLVSSQRADVLVTMQGLDAGTGNHIPVLDGDGAEQGPASGLGPAYRVNAFRLDGTGRTGFHTMIVVHDNEASWHAATVSLRVRHSHGGITLLPASKVRYCPHVWE